MIKEIIISQKNVINSILENKYVHRDNNLNLKRNKPLAKVIIGPRRSGKSYFSLHKLKETGNFGYINFDEERFQNLSNNDELIDAVKYVYNNPEYLLLDEIQNLPKWELFVNRLLREGNNLVITGSNSNLLSSELSTHLTGRYLPFYIFPFSFKEYLRISESEYDFPKYKFNLLNYMERGGYPETLLFDIDSKNYIETLLQSILLKDIVKRYKIRLVNEIEKLANYTIINSGTEFSYSKIAKHLNIKSDKTVEKYLKYFENAFIIFQLSRFSYKYKHQISYNKKIYTYDNSFLKNNEYYYGMNKGKLLENLVAIFFKKKSLETNENIYYYRTRNNYEVDFLTEKNGKVVKLYQVCYDFSNITTYEREIRSLLIAGRELDCKDLFVINLDTETTKEFTYYGKKQEIQFILAQNLLMK